MQQVLKLIFLCLCIIPFNGYSQCGDVTGNINSNPYVCGSYGDANGNSNWNWEITDKFDAQYCQMWQARISGDGNLTAMGSPFVDAATSALDLISQSQDFTKAKGWELLRREFGCSHVTAYPYFVLYNKYTGIMRVFVYQPVIMPQYSQVLLQLEPSKTPFPATTSLGDAIATAPDKYLSSSSSSTFGRLAVSVSEPAGSSRWSLAEFATAFDPNIQNSIYSGSGIKVTIFGVTTSTITASIRGRSVTGSDPAIYNFNYVPKNTPTASPDGQTINFTTAGEKFTKFSKTLTDARNGVNSAANSIFNSLSDVSVFDRSMKGRVKSLAFVARSLSETDEGFGKTLGQIADVLGGAGSALKLIGGVVGFFSGNSSSTPAAMPTYTSYDLQLNGSITARSVSQSFVIRVPGTIQPNNDNATYFRCPMGIFNIKNTPEADVVAYERLVKPGLFPGWANFVSYKMRNNIDVSFNSSAGLDLVSVQAAIAGEVLPGVNENAAYDLLADHLAVNGESNLMLPDLQAGILEITRYEPEKKLHTFQTPYVNMECLIGLAFNARAETRVFLRVKAILKKKNDPNNTPIYYIRDYNIQPFEVDIDANIRNSYRGLGSMALLPPYSNYSEGPSFVVDKIINGNQYANSVEEIADNTISTENSVVVKTGQTVVFKAGYEIALEPGFETEGSSEFEAKLKISQVVRTCGTPVIDAFQYSGNCYNTAISALRTTTDQNSTGNTNTSVGEIKIYPVPTNGKLVISGITNNSNTIISILDQSGRTVREVRSASYESAGYVNLDVSALQNGVYFVKIQTLAQTITKKIVVSK